MQARHQHNYMNSEFPFRLHISDNLHFPHHWHEEVEIIYVMEGSLKIGLNHETYRVEPGDIFLIGSGDVHYFVTQAQYVNKVVVIQFRLSLLDHFSVSVGDRRFTRMLLSGSKRLGTDWGRQVRKELEGQILHLVEEYKGRQDGYKMAIKARLYDIAVVLVRRVPMEAFPDDERVKHRNRLERLNKVFRYLEDSYEKDITAEDAAKVINLSPYHFMRFFKETTGVTFGQYLSNYRISKAEWYLTCTEEAVTDIAFKSGFNSIKTFNRVFRRLKGCSPSDYRKSNI